MKRHLTVYFDIRGYPQSELAGLKSTSSFAYLGKKLTIFMIDAWIKLAWKLVAQECIKKLVSWSIFLKIICVGFLVDVGLISCVLRAIESTHLGILVINIKEDNFSFENNVHTHLEEQLVTGVFPISDNFYSSSFFFIV